MLTFDEADARARVLLEQARTRLSQDPADYLDWIDLAGIFAGVTASLADAGIRPGRRAAHAPSIDGLVAAVARIEELLDRAREARAAGSTDAAAASRAYAFAQAADDACQQLARECG